MSLPENGQSINDMSAISLRLHAREAVARYRARQAQQEVLTRPIEAARAALLAHLLDYSATNRPIDETAATRIAVAVLRAYLDEPVADTIQSGFTSEQDARAELDEPAADPVRSGS